MTWNDITLNTFEEYRSISEDGSSDFEKTIAIVSVVFGIPEEKVLDMPLEEFKEKVSQLQFLADLPAPVQPSEKYVINGTKYRLCMKPKDITAGQWLDFQAVDKDDYARLLSIFLIPEGCKYNEGYDIAEAIGDFENLPIPVVLGIVAFFFILYKAYTKALLAYSLRLTRKVKDPKAKAVREKIKALMASLTFN